MGWKDGEAVGVGFGDEEGLSEFFILDGRIWNSHYVWREIDGCDFRTCIFKLLLLHRRAIRRQGGKGMHSCRLYSTGTKRRFTPCNAIQHNNRVQMTR